ncbi:MAG TPA: ATP-binding cassette domain-containing protein [Candidatus Limnocylindrales bacterium]|nr:ATP-binding cassette domain-containing protein [Candidatus Limnocylindrales bacterium]
MPLVIDSLTKHFGSVAALDGVSFAVGDGQVFGFLGPNGAGKTTTMRILLNILHADSGTATWRGIPSTKLPAETWGYLPEERGLYPRMEVLDQLVHFAALHGVQRRRAAALAREWLERFGIADFAKRRAEELSKGNQQKVQFVAAILHDPAVLLMDEPFAGLDPINVALLKTAFLEMRDRGKTLVFSTHQMEMVEELCEAIAIVDRGRIVVSGPTREVKRSTGRRVVRLGVAGDAGIPWLADLDGVRVTRPGEDYTELDVGADRDPESVLHAALARGEHITRFEIADPSIEQVFIERVGRRPRTEERLAPSPVAVPV